MKESLFPFAKVHLTVIHMKMQGKIQHYVT